MLSVTADEADYDRVTEIVERYGSVDIDERETEWKSQGWSGYTSEGTSAGVAGSSLSTAASSTATGAGYATRDTAGKDDDVIQVMEEQLRVGKRQVNRGKVRIRSYVVETPVEEQIGLRSERVFLERRPVDRPLSAVDETMFRERTIEAEEHSEEAVISKETRVKEELHLRKESEERTERVSDTVRRTEVEIDDERVEIERRGGTKPLAG